MIIKQQYQFVFFAIKVPRMKGSTIIYLLMVEGVIGTGLYYSFKAYTSSELIGLIASIVGTTGIRQTTSMIKKRWLKRIHSN